ncbi:MAG: 5-formyltetrahydrofolate cyclo-ligase [Dysgonamonadaceae bacterium]|jgi:5-formyltetrahydrofolate cyclo-ligase|nr:5-formyltetrahydrofolate cyclo-ligase [Dysgonamonadaceae bacterium]
MNGKDILRKEIAVRKQRYAAEELNRWSSNIKTQIEKLTVFEQAETVLLYCSLPDEVQTFALLSGWMTVKHCLLPQVQGNELIVREHRPGNHLQTGYRGIFEPTGNIFSDLNRIDLILVPGVAFDANKNRLGRGKGYYDRLLTQTTATTVGICFDFQLVEKVPVEDHDVAMDYVVTPTRLL